MAKAAIFLCSGAEKFSNEPHQACQNMHMSLKATILLATLAVLGTGHAQLKCTMPNGVVITQQLSECPRGAVAATTLDGKAAPLPKPRITETPRSTPTPAQAARPAVPPTAPARAAAPEKTSYEAARLVCEVLTTAGATTCEINSNVFSKSTIEATIATSPSDAAQSCRLIASTVRSKTNVFGGNWRILIFSPFSGNRPIGACDL